MTTPVEAPLDVTPALRDGYEVHSAALRRGLNVTLLPRQVMTATRDGIPGELSFVHGVPETSSLSAVTFAQDKRIRRELLEDAGLPVPKGGAFAIGRGTAKAKARLLAEVGYPMVVKPAVGENIIEVHDAIADESQLNDTIEYFWTPALKRPSYVRAAYSLTETREFGEVDGEEVAPPGYRVLVERHVSGQYLRFVVIGGVVHSVLHCPGGPWRRSDRAHVDVTHQTHADLRDLAIQATATIPGLAVAAVDIVAARGYERAADEQEVWVVELSERPWLAAQASVSEHLSADLGNAILTNHAAGAGFSLGKSLNTLDTRVNIEGVTSAQEAAPKIQETGCEAGLSVKLNVTDEVEGVVNGTVSGSARATAWLAESLIDGRIPGCRAMAVDVRPH